MPLPGRRRFLQAVGGGLVVAFSAGCNGLPVIPWRPAPRPQDASGWIRHADGRYVLFLPRVEMGQGVASGLKRIACDELGVPWDAVEMRFPSTSDIGRVRATVGSESLRDFALPLAQACATLREAVAAGAEGGVLAVRARPPEQLRSLSRRSADAPVGGHPRIAQTAMDGTRRGRLAPLEQGTEIVRGAPLYVGDVRRPGMVFGRVLRAPVAPDLASRALSMDEAAARAVSGFVALIRDPLLVLGRSEGVGIVARTPGALDRIERALAIRWHREGEFDARAIDEALDIDARLSGRSARTKRLASAPIDAGASWDVDLRLDVPLAAHASIEARACVAEPDGQGGLHAWVGSQDVFYQRDVIARRLGLAPDRVVVQGCRVGGGFGGRTICTVELEAAVLARAVGAPVKVQWTRAQEFGLAFHRPPSSHRVRVRLGADGRLAAWWHAFASSHVLFTGAVLPAWLQRATDLALGDDGVARGALPPYGVDAVRVEFDLARLPVWTGPWRGLGAGPNVMAIECAIDECARVAGRDPVAFRLDHVADARLAGVLRQVATVSGWRQSSGWGQSSGTTAPGVRRGRGVACGVYKGAGYAAVVAEVDVTETSGEVVVRRLWCAHDCGRVIDPDQVRAQCEGNLVWGLGMTLVERLPVGDSRVGAATFADYPIPRFGDVPPMDIVLVDSDEPPGAAGETAIVAAGAAIANAVRAACGVRASRLPISPDALASAMRSTAPGHHRGS